MHYSFYQPPRESEMLAKPPPEEYYDIVNGLQVMKAPPMEELMYPSLHSLNLDPIYGVRNNGTVEMSAEEKLMRDM